jgi:hypothetical protein
MALEQFRRASRSKLNFTDRHALAESGISISVDPATMPLELRVNQLTLPAVIPDGAQVLVEAYRSSTGHYERVSFGDAAPFKSGTGVGTARPLQRIQSAEGLRFRVKIVEGGNARLIAEADGIRSVEESDESSVDDLFPVVPRTLKGELWKVNFTDGNAPQIHVEKSLDHHGVFLWALPAFQAVALPIALRQVAERMIRGRNAEETWHERWAQFLNKLHPGFAEAFEVGEEETDEATVEMLLDDIASAFARKFNLLESGKAAFRDVGDE